MRLSFIATISAGLLSLLTGAIAMGQTAAVRDSSCATSLDKFEAPYRLTAASEKLANRCINSKSFRAIQNLQINDQTAHFNNFKHAGEYFEADLSLRPEDIEAVYHQIVRFPIAGIVEAAHVQLRFKLKKPISLKGQLDSKNASTNDLLISFEAGRPENEAYNFAMGIFNNYVLVGRTLSMEQRMLDSKEPHEQYELNLNPEERALLLKNALQRAFDIQMNLFYSTLRPNCTTEALDLIDTLPRFKGKYAPFLTVISNDPVARPSLQALKLRGLIQQRVQNYAEEAQGKFQVLPSADDKTISLPFLPQIPGRPWTVAVTLPDMERLSAQEKMAIKALRTELIKILPRLLQGVGAAITFGDQSQNLNASSIMIATMKTVEAELLALLKNMNQQMPTQATSLGIYLIPMPSVTGLTSIESLGIPAALPFSIKDFKVSEAQPKSKEVFYHISEGTRQAGDVGNGGKELAFFRGAGIRLLLAKNASQFASQIMIGLKDQQRPFTMKNSQVAFSDSVISGGANRNTRPVVLITHSQKTTDNMNPVISIEFGADGGIAGTLDLNKYGLFQINAALDGSCQQQSLSTPTLRGVLAEAALNKPILDRLVQGKKVGFSIFGAKLNIADQKVIDMDVRVSTWPMNCLEVSSVKTEFANNANQMLNKFKTEAQSSDFISKIISGFLSKKN